MTMVRFATVCDRCEKRSQEYSSWPSCRECLDDICPDCQGHDTLIDADLDSPATCLCVECVAAWEAVA